MRTKGSTTKKPESTSSNSSKELAIVESPQEVLMPYSDDLKQEVSQQMSLTVAYAQRLQNLIHSEVETLEAEYLENDDNGESRTRKLSSETVHTIKELGCEFRETIKLGCTLAGVKMRIERGESA